MALTMKYGRSAGIYHLAAIKSAKKKQARKNKKLRKKYAKSEWNEPPYASGMGSDFYLTREWKQERWAILDAAQGKCRMCGRGAKDNVVLHVDHIQPRSKFPTLELSPTNLQVLCADCNLGKGASYQETNLG